MTIMQHASKFIELSWFIHEFVALERMKIRRFKEALAFYICNQLARQQNLIDQQLYERAAEIKWVIIEWRALNPIN